jgi:hypothetical protein
MFQEMFGQSHDSFTVDFTEDDNACDIDPNENLNDWSFLNADPEPLPEQTEEDRLLFKQFLTLLICNGEIHEYLASVAA